MDEGKDYFLKRDTLPKKYHPLTINMFKKNILSKRNVEGGKKYQQNAYIM